MSNDTSVKKILILAANPKQTPQLRLDEEVRDIREGLRLAKNRDRFILEARWAVRPRDIRREILDFRPHIIHFSGHGAGETGLCFEDEMGQLQLVTGEALAGLFKQFARQIECVLLNACYSEEQAKAIVQHIDYVIGMNKPIGDKAAIEFAVGFYDALAGFDPQYDEGSPVEFAYDIACNAISLEGLSGELIPVIKKKPNLVPREPENKPVNINNSMNTSQLYTGRNKLFVCERLVNQNSQRTYRLGKSSSDCTQ
ncbi:CHAT domain-containing protein [Aerosakkonemataceae cyanobacterium BLCC-F50]|uniref:CHAT domain-containing protein n=1 Tax=Floridaenema flaviceps BLCC-F50 TaxID=3153642 RepID=A0ABV4XUR8_9CYAN